MVKHTGTDQVSIQMQYPTYIRYWQPNRRSFALVHPFTEKDYY